MLFRFQKVDFNANNKSKAMMMSLDLQELQHPLHQGLDVGWFGSEIIPYAAPGTSFVRRFIWTGLYFKVWGIGICSACTLLLCRAVGLHRLQQIYCPADVDRERNSQIKYGIESIDMRNINR